MQDRDIEFFREKKREIYAECREDVRILERLAKLNPELVRCPKCGGGMEVNHWEKESEDKLLPFFKCRVCGFLC